MNRRLALAALLCAAVVLPWTARGYSYGGHRWASADVPYFVNATSRYLTESQVLAALQAAADNWPSQSGANIRYSYAGRTSGTSLVNNGINEVFFRNETNGSYAGLTYYWYGSDGSLIDADTVFYEGQYTLYGGSTGCTGSGSIYLEDLATHEFGHALGLHHSGDTTATMYSGMGTWCSQNWRTLSTDDINGIRAAYPVSAPAAAPVAPASLAAAPGIIPQSEIKLTWSDRSADETGFVIERSLTGLTFTQVAQVGANVTSYVNTGLLAGTTYWYRVYARNGSGPSGYSNVASLLTAVLTQPPAMPSSPSPPSGSINVQPSSLAWAPTARAQNYDVYFGTSSAPPRVASAQTATSWTPGKLEPGTKYYWRVVARNSVGTTSGATWTFTTRARGNR
jgi:hypothetical protein